MTEFEKISKERLERNSFMLYNHIEVESIERDRAVFRMEIRPENRNPFGQAHGGALYTLADNAAGGATHTDGRLYVTQTSTMHYMGNQKDGVLRAAAYVRHRGRSTCLTIVDITGEGGKLLATGEFTFFRVDRPLMEKPELNEDGTPAENE